MKDDYVNIEEIWVPCEEGEGHGVTKDGKHYMLAAIIANNKPLFLAQDCVLENIKMTPQEFENKFPQKSASPSS